MRFGYIAEPLSKNGYLQNTCSMEPGDSGGALVDISGRLIGLRSRIDRTVDKNYDVPVNLYRRYRSALLKSESYTSLPAKEDLGSDLQMELVYSLTALNQMPGNFRKIRQKYGEDASRMNSRGIEIQVRF